MADSGNRTSWDVVPRLGELTMHTSRVGLVSVSGKAPFVGGKLEVAEAPTLDLQTALSEFSTGKGILDRSVAGIISKHSDGILRFNGQANSADDLTFVGNAVCGTIDIPISLTCHWFSDDALTVDGMATFTDLHLPIPGFGNVKKLDLTLGGQFHVS